MSLKQCSGCAVMMDEVKAFCSNCGNPMDDEQKRAGSTEFDSLAKTQNLNATKHFEILEQFNLPMVFAHSQKTSSVSPQVELATGEAVKPSAVEPNLSTANDSSGWANNSVKKNETVYKLPTWNLDVHRNEARLGQKIYLVISLLVILLVLLLVLGIVAVYFIVNPKSLFRKFLF